MGIYHPHDIREKISSDVSSFVKLTKQVHGRARVELRPQTVSQTSDGRSILSEEQEQTVSQRDLSLGSLILRSLRFQTVCSVKLLIFVCFYS